MEIYENGRRFSEKYKWEDLKNQPYNYTKKGLLNHILSHKITETRNPILKVILNYYEYSISYVFRTADILKNFKNYNWKN